MVQCNSCFARPVSEDLLEIETEYGNRLYFCTPCVKKALDTLLMRIHLSKEQKLLLKNIKRFLKINGKESN